MGGNVLKLVFTTLCLAFSGASAQTDTLSPPKYELVDKFNVNMATGQVQITQTPLAIGGELGLRQTISSYTSDFVNYPGLGGGVPTVLGFRDSNRGGFYSVVLSKYNQFPTDWLYGIRAFGGGFSEDFRLTATGEFVPFNQPNSSTLTFESNADFAGYVLTTADGTRLFYPGTQIQSLSSSTLIRRTMTKVIHANGFTIDVDSHPDIDGPIFGVRTNTGFQLKYDFQGSWTNSSPTKVVALNTAIEVCPSGPAPCTPSSHWPQATYTWPLGQPSATDSNSLKVNSVFSVQDSIGKVTEYHHSVYEAQSGHFAPRLVRIKEDNKVIMNYDYEWLDFYVNQASNVTIITYYGIATVGEASVPGGGSQSYSMHRPKSQSGATIGNINGAGGGYQRIQRVESTNFGALVAIDAWDQSVDFDYEPISGPGGIIRVNNTVDTVYDKRGNILTEFEYDQRGNVTQRTQNGISRYAEYEASCTSNNYKYCNKPKWTEDARGNKTHFTYHPASGQIASVTSPANGAGIEAKVVYQYGEYYAHYKQNGGAVEPAERPIWLLTSETTCQNTAMTSSGTCIGNDAVVTTYQYDFNNLYVRGVAVTAENAEGHLETRRVCYEYDRYGNRIGETTPRANRTTCL